MEKQKSMVKLSMPKSGTTGEKVPRTGRYICIDHMPVLLSFSKGDIFPVCPKKCHTATWVLIYKTK